MTYGDNPTVEFIHAENVTKALVLTASKLLDKSSPVVSLSHVIPQFVTLYCYRLVLQFYTILIPEVVNIFSELN